MHKKCLLVPALWGDFNHGLERTLALIADGLRQRGHSVDVAARVPIDLDVVRRVFGAQLQGVELRSVATWGESLKRIPLVGQNLAGLAERSLFRRLTAGYDFVLVQNGYIPAASAAKRSVLFTEFPRDTKPTSRDWLSRLASYDLVVGNSEFTCSWIRRFWDIDCEVFYPSIQECTPLQKEQMILGVGRFAAGGRSKGQLEMVETFRRLVDQGTANVKGWKLVLAGIEDDPDYLAEVRSAGEGYPIDIVLGASAKELAAVYGRASIFWHTTGLGVDQEREPQRLEHFGIVVAEAMSAGCVPLVFDAAGPREIVANPELCFQSLDELVEKTKGLVDDPSQLVSLAAGCRASAVERFGEGAFDRSIDRLLGTD